MISELLISPIWIVVVTMLLWTTIFNIFYRVLKISETNWKRLEYAWILTGFIGLISLVVENKRTFESFTSQRILYFIKQDISMLNSTLNSSQTCFKFTKTEYSPTNFDELQYDQDQVCKWSKSYKVVIDSLTGIPVEDLDSINTTSLRLKTNDMGDFIARFNEDVKEINDSLSEYRLLTDSITNNGWKNFSQTFGVILVSIAFAIRLAIATKNVVQSKNSS